MQTGGFRKGQGEVLTTLLLAEVIVVILVFISWYLIVEDRQALLKHPDLDQKLTQEALHSFPHAVQVERTDGTSFFVVEDGDGG